MPNRCGPLCPTLLVYRDHAGSEGVDVDLEAGFGWGVAVGVGLAEVEPGCDGSVVDDLRVSVVELGGCCGSLCGEVEG